MHLKMDGCIFRDQLRQYGTTQNMIIPYDSSFGEYSIGHSHSKFKHSDPLNLTDSRSGNFPFLSFV